MDLEQRVQALEERNKRVEADKAWEVSNLRTLMIAVITYVIAALVMKVISVNEPWLNALIPTLGYLLSRVSLRVVEKWWRERF